MACPDVVDDVWEIVELLPDALAALLAEGQATGAGAP
jgi:hypothetical protein